MSVLAAAAVWWPRYPGLGLSDAGQDIDAGTPAVGDERVYLLRGPEVVHSLPRAGLVSSIRQRRWPRVATVELSSPHATPARFASVQAPRSPELRLVDGLLTRPQQDLRPTARGFLDPAL